MDCIIVGIIFAALCIGALIVEARRYSNKQPRTFKELEEQSAWHSSNYRL